MKTIVETEAELHAFLSSVLRRSKWLPSQPDSFITEERNPQIWAEGLVGVRSGKDDGGKRKISLCPTGNEMRFISHPGRRLETVLLELSGYPSWCASYYKPMLDRNCTSRTSAPSFWSSCSVIGTMGWVETTVGKRPVWERWTPALEYCWFKGP